MALVQTTAQLRTQESGASSNLAFGSNVTAGSALFLYVGNYPSGISSVSDSRGNTWQKADGVGDGGINFGEIWYALNAAAGATTITISPTSGSGNYLTAWAQEWSGVQTSGALDRTGTATNTNTVSTSLATQQADELVLTVAVADAGAANINWGTPTDYTLVGRENDSNNYTGLQAAYRVVAATGTQSATHTVSGIATSAVDAVIATFRLASGGTAYTLTADSGSFALTGTAASLLAGRKLAADAGSFTLTGTAANTLFGRKLTAEAASFALTGADAALKAGRLLSAEAGSFALTGTDATLTYEPAGSYTLTADSGSFALTGGDVGLIAARVLSAEAGSFALTGSDAALLFGRRLQADAAVFSLVGQDATLTYEPVSGAYTLTAEPGVFSLTGGDVRLVAPERDSGFLGGGNYDFLNPRSRKRKEDEDESKEPAAEVVVGPETNWSKVIEPLERAAQQVDARARLLQREVSEARAAEADRVRQRRRQAIAFLLLS